MATFRFRYATDVPPTPAVLLNLAHPFDPTLQAPDRPALLDTGADQTVIPDRLIAARRLTEVNAVEVRSYDGARRRLSTYLIRLQIRDHAPIEVEVIASPDISNVILGRDVSNRYTITLNGPAGRLTVSDDPAP